MKILLIFLVNVLLGAPIFGESLTELLASFKAHELRIQKTLETKTTKLGGSYQEALQKLQIKYQNGNRLNDALRVKKEITEVSQGKWPLTALRPTAPSGLISARKLFTKSYIRIQQEHGEALVKSADKMDKLLEKFATTLTKNGDLESALKVKAQQESLKIAPSIVGARQFLKRVGKSGGAKSAFRLRRQGDNIEVLVRYDTEGKVSFDSPIENVVEITGSKKEKGETSALRLGGFLGAEGFQGESFTVFDHKFDKEGLEPLVALDIDSGKVVEVDGKSGLILTINEKAKNPMISLPPGTLPPENVSSGFKITFEYLVPKSNRKVSGWSYQQGGGFPLGERTEGKIGKWKSEVVEGTSLSKFDFLRLYMSGSVGSKIADIRGDTLIVHSLRIEITRPAAFICESFGPSAESLGQSTKEVDQKIFALNGLLVEDKSK